MNDASNRSAIVLGLVGAAGLIGGTAFAGWVFDVFALKNFGVPGNPIWPLTAIGFIFLSAGFWATVQQHRAAPVLVAVPLLIAVCVLIQEMGGISLGTDNFLFADQLTQLKTSHPGRPGPTTVAAFGLLGLALLFGRDRRRALAELANLLATAALCFGIFSIVLLLPLGPARESPREIVQLLAARLPAGLATIALACAFLLWRREAGWMLLLNARGRGK